MTRLAWILSLLILTVAAHAAEPATIAYVDVDKVLSESDMGRKAKEALEQKFAEPQKTLAAEEQGIIQLQQSLGRDQALMSQEELDKRKTEIQQRVLELQKKAAEFQQELNEEQNAMGGEILKLAQDLVAEIARERKLSAVYERTRSGLLYIDDNLNITAEVIKRLNAKTSAKK